MKNLVRALGRLLTVTLCRSDVEQPMLGIETVRNGSSTISTRRSENRRYVARAPLSKFNPRRWAVQMALTTGLALLFSGALLWGLRGVTPAQASSAILYVDGATGSDTTHYTTPAALTPTTRYVATTGSDSGNDCTGQGSPCQTVQRAVEVADPGDVIRVAAGTYSDVGSHPAPPGPYSPPSGVITQTVYISKTVTIQGGYTTTNWTSPDPDTNLTTLDAQGQGRVLYIAREINPTITGLRITGGDAVGLRGAWEDAGGGVYVANATAVFSGTHICDNSADWGGGLYVAAEGEVTLLGSTVCNNTANEGAGLYVNHSAARLDDSTVSNNGTDTGAGANSRASSGTLGAKPIGLLGAPGSGGGMAAWARSTLTIANSSIISNTAEHGGGAGVCLNESTATFHGSNISGNTTRAKGGGLVLWYNSAAVLESSTLMGNSSNEGGGLVLGFQCTVTLINNFIADNEASSMGGALYVLGSSAYLAHNTVVGNRAGDGSGVYLADYPTGTFSTADLTNNILANHAVGIRVTEGSAATLESTLWNGNTTDWHGAGTIHRNNDYWGDPFFVNPGMGNYHIALVSAAIDKGVETNVDTDFDGDPRPLGPAADIGADEWTGFGLFLPLTLRNFGS